MKIAGKPSHLTVFDLDHTLIGVNISYAFGKYLYKIGVLSFSAMVKIGFAYAGHTMGNQSLQWLHNQSFENFFKNFPRSLLEMHVKDFCNLYLTSLINLPCFLHLEKAKKSQSAIALLSSSPDFLVEPIAERFGIPSWIGTCYASDENGLLSHISLVVDGAFKAEYLRRLMTRYQIEKDQISVLSDSILDLPIFEMAGVKIGVNPDRKLAALCRKNGWKILL